MKWCECYFLILWQNHELSLTVVDFLCLAHCVSWSPRKTFPIVWKIETEIAGCGSEGQEI